MPLFVYFLYSRILCMCVILYLLYEYANYVYFRPIAIYIACVSLRLKNRSQSVSQLVMTM